MGNAIDGRKSNDDLMEFHQLEESRADCKSFASAYREGSKGQEQECVRSLQRLLARSLAGKLIGRKAGV